MVRPAKFCCCCKILEGSKIICFLEIFRLLYIGLSSLIYGIRMLSNYMLGYFLTLFVLFSFLSVLAIRTFIALNDANISKWIRVKTYYKWKFYVIVIWSIGYYTFMIVCWYNDIPELIMLGNSLPVAFGIILDLYFTYCLYSCYELGINGKFAIVPQIGQNQNEIFTIRKAESNENLRGIITEYYKEVVAFPENKFIEGNIKGNELTIIKDFTSVDNENK
ncbi:hypothetical protein SteCoe_11666 [Stentor coeruleus]|uniref:Uncharacterized protein n=1 Tax=Stentor coeruleus TaxID=5963 RepID=A0A1R2CCN0_9CILI|nr:hypothetical protein SteCoe_11666 [Stentor coeruleus]